jgi:S1-C subfamily serine protease
MRDNPVKSLLPMKKRTWAFFAVFSMLLPLGKPVLAGEINACKYLVVTDFTSDSYGIAEELRAQGNKKGFVVVSAVNDVPQADLLKTCVISGSWSRDLSGGHLAMRVVDAGGELVGEASAGASRMGVSATVHALVGKIYSQLGYTGFDENVYRARIQREYPERPKLATTEEDIEKGERRSHVEGIWADTEDKYRLGIVPAPAGSSADFVAVVLRSSTPLWQAGEIKAEIRSTASPYIFTCTYFMANKKPGGTTLTLEHDGVLRGSVATSKGPFELLLMRVWPESAKEPADPAATSEKSGASGTGFVISRTGLLATNWHVVNGAKNISVVFPGSNSGVKAEVVIRDVVNDLAVLRMTETSKIAAACPELPFGLSSAEHVTLGQHVSTIGYPLTSLLGSNPKFSEGVVASKTGFQDDPRSFQVSAQVQPGSSGSPLFDGEGNVIGVVVATLDAGKLYQVASALPQNVNWAIKSDYLLNLVRMLPGQDSVSRRETAFTPEKAAGCVAIISAW